MFTLVCVCTCVNVQHCINGNANANIKNGFRPILCICVCVSIDTMVNYDNDVDANTNVKCEHTLKHALAIRIVLSRFRVENVLNSAANFYVTWGARADLQTAPGAPLPPFGKAMGKLANDDLKAVIEKGLVQYSRENRELDILIFKEVSVLCCTFVSI